jgi:biotin carboxylase
MSSDGVTLVVGSGGQLYREYILASAAQRRPLWLLDAAEPTWQRPYLSGSTVVDLLDGHRLIPDQEGLITAAHEVAAQWGVAGVFTYDETLVIATAHMAEKLGVPGLSVAGAENCRNKHRTRMVLTEAGFVQPRFAFVTELDDAREAAAAFGYPVVVKPRGMGASIGVVMVRDPVDLQSAFAVAEGSSHDGNPSYEGGALVEEYLDGPEISIDGATSRGRYHPLFIARKDVGLAPYFEETGHLVDAADPLVSDSDLIAMLAQAHVALGIRDGITHTEVKFTARGPAIIEVNGRLGGDLIPYLGWLASGIDPGHVAVDVATGVAPTVTPWRRRTAGIRFLYPPRDGTIREISLPTKEAVPELLRATAMVPPGTVLRLPPNGYISRYAHLICSAEDPAACAAALDMAATRASVDLGPVSEE